MALRLAALRPFSARLSPPPRALATLLAGAPPAVLALLLTASQAPGRTIAGVYFAVLLIPALQVLAGAFFGWPAALGTGALLAALTVWQVSGPPPPLEAEPVQWPFAFTAANQQVKVTLAPPPRSAIARVLAEGGDARLFLCSTKGSTEDWQISFDGRTLPVVARPSTSNCWLQLRVIAETLPPNGSPAEVIVQPRGGALPPEAERSVLVGGWTQPAAQGGRSGGAAFFDGTRWRTDSLSPIVEQPQTGRYFVELRAFSAAGALEELWY